MRWWEYGNNRERLQSKNERDFLCVYTQICARILHLYVTEYGESGKVFGEVLAEQLAPLLYDLPEKDKEKFAKEVQSDLSKLVNKHNIANKLIKDELMVTYNIYSTTQ